MKILYTIETLEIGGAEKFVIELANSVSNESEVFLFIVFQGRVNPYLLDKISNRVTIVSKELLLDYLIQKIDSLLYRMLIPIRFRDVFIKKRLETVLNQYKIEIIHSNQFNTDNICLQASLIKNIPVIATIHGDYLNFYRKHNDNQRIYGNINFLKRLEFILSNLKTIVCISDQQLVFFKNLAHQGLKNNGTVKIYNGISRPIFNKSDKDSIGVKNENFIFGMIARGIEEKGWQIAIDAFIELNNNSAYLILVGESDYIQSLKKKYISKRNILFTGFASNPAQWIQHFDVGLLPTTYQSESLPTAIIEYLAQGKPVIATDLGEIKNMLCKNNNCAGILLSQNLKGSLSSQLFDAMKICIEDTEFLENCKNSTNVRSTQFKIEKCSDNYLSIYNQNVKNK